METNLNTDNIARSTGDVEYHPLRPFLPENAKVLFLGSFPPQRKRWCMDFYYPNFINDHWRIEGEVFFGDRNHFVDVEAKRFRLDEIVAFCRQRGIAFYDTATAVRRLQDNASDKFLEVVEPTDVRALMGRLPGLRLVVTTGEKATGLFTAHFGIPAPRVGTWVPFTFGGRALRLYRMPSSSRAYPMRVERKADYYRAMLCDIYDDIH